MKGAVKNKLLLAWPPTNSWQPAPTASPRRHTLMQSALQLALPFRLANTKSLDQIPEWLPS